MRLGEADLQRIRLRNQEFEGDNSSYVLEGDGETALIDTGVSTPGTKERFVESLRVCGVEVDCIDTVLLTHWHADHVGLAGYVQEESGAAVRVHEDDAPLVAGDEAAWDAMYERQRRFIDDWGMPDGKREELLGFLGSTEEIYGEPPELDVFTDGELMDVAGTEVECLQASGHTAGSTCFVLDDVAFTGDALLPVYTPNVGGADVRVKRPLESYLDSLVSIAERGFGRAYPGHREPIEKPSERAAEIVEHHRERAERVVGVLRDDGPLDAWEVGARLFGELNGIHVLHGPGESYAHLEHLERGGVVSSFREGTVKYTLEDDGGVGGLFPETDSLADAQPRE